MSAEAVRRHGVRVEAVKRRVLGSSFSAPARVAFNAEAMAHVGCRVTGRVTELKVKVGEAVKGGDVLVVVESPELGEAQGEFLQKRAAVAAAGGPMLEAARSGYDRARKLYDEAQGISLTDLQKRESEFMAAQSALTAAKTAAAAAESKLRLLGMAKAAVAELAKTGEIDPTFAVRAPIAGRVIEREVTLGELVGPDRDRLLLLADLTTLWVLAEVPEARVGGLSTGAAARVSIAAAPDKPVDGTVTFIGHSVDPATRTVPVRIEVSSAGRDDLKPGMFARAEIGGAGDQGEGDAVLAVPEGAIQTIEGASAVFVPIEGEPNTFAARPIKAGKPVGGFVPVTSGLKAGEAVVVSGAFILKAELGKAGAGHGH